MKEEFACHGLPDATRYVMGTLKVGAGIIMLVGLWWRFPAMFMLVTCVGIFVARPS